MVRRMISWWRSGAVLFALDYAGVTTTPEQKAAIATAAAWLAGKVAAWMTPERHPIGPEQRPTPTPPTL